MYMPATFFGDHAKMKAKSRKIVTQLLRGRFIAANIDPVDVGDSEAYLDPLFWLEQVPEPGPLRDELGGCIDSLTRASFIKYV
jgi:hypothetical protein